MLQYLSDALQPQRFSTFFGSRHPVRLKKIWWHPYLAKMTIRGTLNGKKTKKVVNSIVGNTSDTSSRHPSWEPLPYNLHSVQQILACIILAYNQCF